MKQFKLFAGRKKPSVPVEGPPHIYVPREGRNVEGMWTFRTSDGQRYIRDKNGCIRRQTPQKSPS